MSDDKRTTELPIVSGQSAAQSAAQLGGAQGAVGEHADTRSAPPEPRGMDRRHALKIMAIAAATPAALTSCEPGGGGDAAGGAASAPAPTRNPNARGDAWDPDLINPTVPWERSLTEDELDSLAVLCDVIIPADDRSPAASTVGAPEFIDEWVSAPYDGMRNDKVTIRGGLMWLDSESAERFGAGRRFRDLTQEQQHAICDDISWTETAEPGYEAGARFFAKVRDLTATAFWTTTEGMQDLQYIGNTPLASWGPPPPEVLRHLGLE